MADTTEKTAILNDPSIPVVAKRKSVAAREIVPLVKQTILAWSEDNAASMGAAIAFYTIFSITPLILIAIAISGFVFGREAAEGHIFAEARSIVGESVALTLQDLVKSAQQPAKSTLAAVLGAIVMMFGASGVFTELQSAMDRIWRTPVTQRQSGFWYMISRRLFTFGMVTGTAFVLLVSFILSILIASLESVWNPLIGDASIFVLQATEFGVSFLVITGVFALIFKLVPRIIITWNDVIIGAIVTSLLFNLGKLLIGIYISNSGIISGFGAAGTLIALLLWVYYSAQIFLLGAEFTWIYANTHGSRAGAEK